MRRLVVLGAGTAGTMVVNRLRRRLDPVDWEMTVVDQSDRHFYRPGYLFIPFGTYTPDEVVEPRQRFIPDGVDLVYGGADRIDADVCEVLLTDGRSLPYDYLVIATGVEPRPDQTPGMLDAGR
jgi:sulfide:quinone oxidoreductase